MNEKVIDNEVSQKSLPGSSLKKTRARKCPMHISQQDGNPPKIKFESTYTSLPEPFTTILKELTCTDDEEVARELFDRAALALPKNTDPSDRINITFQTLSSNSPQDIIETRLCLQAHVLYSQGMQYITKAEFASEVPLKEFYMKSANKLLRLHLETTDALNKHRRGGGQHLLVQHVYVNQGGQAVVGNIGTGGGSN